MTKRIYNLANLSIATQNQITYHQLTGTTATSINDSFESTQSHVNQGLMGYKTQTYS